MRYSLLAGGKRIRPVLALATARALGARPGARAAGRRGDRADPHLLADPRRPAGDGRRRAAPRPPTSHVAYGENVAILAGDGLFAEAYGSSASASRASPRGARGAARAGSTRPASTAWSAASTSTSPAAPSSTPTGLRALHALKTGRLIAASVGVVPSSTAPANAETIALPPLRRRARRPVPDRRRHPRRDRQRRASSASRTAATSATASSPTSASSASSGRASSPASRTRKATAALAEARRRRRDDLSAITDFIYTRHA